MNSLIKIEVNERYEQLVSARELHEKLGIEKRFSAWWEQQVARMGLVENQDYCTSRYTNSNNQEFIDYVLPIDMGKHLCMISGVCNDGNPFSTATGTVPGKGTFAVNPELIPYYSKMFILGDSWIEQGQALDTGAAMREPDLELPRVDIFKRTYSEAMRFGRQRVWAVIEK